MIALELAPAANLRTRGSHFWFAPFYAMLAQTWLVVTSAVTTDGYQFARFTEVDSMSGFVRSERVKNDTLCRNQHGFERAKVMGYAYALAPAFTLTPL
ncbi:hypothetical protein SAMN05216222_3652 [Pseudomonas prosekii]|uniref:Uncharacterized protein n=2 Tax=Pseudomonas prosekii TaxID=1148509 RepID=A0A1H1YXN7_9PSED|nr:hypothetical protein SAMN05216222_3652 [Pseudomonas prosekii]